MFLKYYMIYRIDYITSIQNLNFKFISQTPAPIILSYDHLKFLISCNEFCENGCLVCISNHPVPFSRASTFSKFYSQIAIAECGGRSYFDQFSNYSAFDMANVHCLIQRVKAVFGFLIFSNLVRDYQ